MAAETDALQHGALLSAALKALRRRRGLTVLAAARAMGMHKRTYEHFESGKGQLDVDRVHEAGEAFRVDAYAILAAIDIGSPQFAARCADNQMMAAIMFAVQEFDARVGDDIALLDTPTLMFHFSRMFAALGEEARRRRELRLRRPPLLGPNDDDPSE